MGHVGTFLKTTFVVIHKQKQLRGECDKDCIVVSAYGGIGRECLRETYDEEQYMEVVIMIIHYWDGRSAE